MTNAKVFAPASTTDHAVAQVDAWLASPQASVLNSGQFHDARIAAICLENAVAVLWTADRDFGRFKALKTVNPLV